MVLFILSLTRYDSLSSYPRYQEIFCIFCWYYRAFVIKSLKGLNILFSKQHILNFPGKMGCSILCACVGEKTFVHLQAVVGKYCQNGLEIKIALHPIPPQYLTLPTPERWKSLLCVGTPGIIVFHLSPCQLKGFHLLCACSPGVIAGMCEQQPFSAWLGSQQKHPALGMPLAIVCQRHH